MPPYSLVLCPLVVAEINDMNTDQCGSKTMDPDMALVSSSALYFTTSLDDKHAIYVNFFLIAFYLPLSTVINLFHNSRMFIFRLGMANIIKIECIERKKYVEYRS